MKCPRCQASFTATPDAGGTVVCVSCGARLRARAADAPAPAAAPPAPPPPAPPAAAPRAEPPAPRAPAPPPPPPPPPSAPPPPPPAPEPDGASAALLRQLLDEMKALREGQERILARLDAVAAAPPVDVVSDGLEPMFSVPSAAAPSATAVRSRRRKTVVLFDDDAATRSEALAALQAAEVPARGIGDGHAGIAAIADERPDVIVLELGMGGSLAGKDVVNMIKATMEWVDIPIVLYTRLPVESQKEARQVHGADEVVLKGPGGAEALVARVIAVFRRQ